MYIPYTFLIAIENDRLRTARRHHFGRVARREMTASLAGETGRPRRGMIRRLTRGSARPTAVGAPS